MVDPPNDITLPDAEMADWSREAVVPGRYEPWKRLLATVRLYASLSEHHDPVSRARRKWAVAQHRFWSMVCGAEVPLGTKISGGLLLPHPQGVVIHNEAVIGPNCLIMSNVTIGVTRQGGPPVLEGGVDVGTGAKLLGPITIGAHAQIGANAVVVSDVPPRAVAVGIPARIIRKR